MKNVKELVKVGFLLFLVVFFAIIVTTTKGKDPLRFDFDLNIEIRDKNEFSFPIVNSEYNGEYRNNKGNSVYVLVGKNNDETYRVYFLRNSDPIVKLDSAKLEGNKISFIDNNNVKLKLLFTKDGFHVSSDLSLGNAQLEGEYIKMKSISTFSSDQIEYYRY